MKQNKQLIIELMILMTLVLPSAVYGGMSAYYDSEWTQIERARAHVATKMDSLIFIYGIPFEGPGRIRYHIRLKIGPDYRADTVWFERIRTYEKNDSILAAAIKSVQFDSAYFKDKSVLDSVYVGRLEIHYRDIPDSLNWNPDPYH